MLVVYFSGKSENTHKFIQKLDIDSKRISISETEILDIEEPYVLVVPSYGGGEVKGSVPLQVINFLNKENNRNFIRGVIGSGNTNFGNMFCYGAKVISEKCNVPLLYKFELMGTTRDVENVRRGVIDFGKDQ